MVQSNLGDAPTPSAQAPTWARRAAAPTGRGLPYGITGATPAKPGSQEAGLAGWRELALTAQNTHWDPITESTWVYDGTTFWTGDDPKAIQARAAYAKSKGLAGMFAFALENDDNSGTLLNTLFNSLG
ncbi:glycosyl hydrolase family 18 protein [Kitasatospora sp. NPDC059673]|uniref:glycosyl hydrolase family 18 protein n=1 Tax=Kitasatospora sp. NPDC059673 TaxID=3346901 RepID=UPI0036761710